MFFWKSFVEVYSFVDCKNFFCIKINVFVKIRIIIFLERFLGLIDFGVDKIFFLFDVISLSFWLFVLFLIVIVMIWIFFLVNFFVIGWIFFFLSFDLLFIIMMRIFLELGFVMDFLNDFRVVFNVLFNVVLLLIWLNDLMKFFNCFGFEMFELKLSSCLVCDLNEIIL